MTRLAYTFLQQHGYINSGVPKDTTAAAAEATEMAAAEAALITEAAAKADYDLALQAFAILESADMEVRPMN